MISEKLISKHALPNSLSLELWDMSGPVAGDRWQVVLEARITIPITAANLPPELRPQIAEVIKALGPQIVFSQQKVRNFIAAAEVPGLLEEMAARFLTSVAIYLGSPGFAPKFIHKNFAAHQEKQRWHKR